MTDLEKVIKGLECCIKGDCRENACPYALDNACRKSLAIDALSLLKAQEPDESKYEYHTDHTDCPWYISGEERKCPVTCSQYRDGWNDAMDYIYKGGNGYRPYKRR